MRWRSTYRAPKEIGVMEEALAANLEGEEGLEEMINWWSRMK